ncbi:DNA-binding transcriptional regulator, AcrR family [Evansella caseinilytica]|uniref:DNA-binding transcriptional regulator, AcrR family n=1 Tax=Evansella caseinilytica TaxID=1503961 RepID=A0A1H3H558_9BACI|nr:TetR/AcrR family transcriptional regulator [Evansella caseinilytica]SDY09789.1 DNA-binding transcriptional regulator, AcrR family [Evansella caseinilytica]
MKRAKNDVSKELIIETALRLIEQNRGIKNVNLRGIAKEIGCAHTNLYNYFNSFDEIIWETLGQILLKMIDYVEINIVSAANDEEKFYAALKAILEFSLMHPGWYRIVWFESIGGTPTPRIAEILVRPMDGLNDLLIKASGGMLTDEKANNVASILHSYLHGEVCKLISDRNPTSCMEETCTRILSNLKQLYQLLITEEEQ